MRNKLLIAAVTTAFLPSLAHAATCEETFKKSGSPISGSRFLATVDVPGLQPASAINQMRGIVTAKGYDVLATEAADGSMLIEQPQTGKARAFPITITATHSGGMGTVQMEAKLRAGQMTSSEAAKTEMCGMLAQLKTGKAGQSAAASGANAVNNSAPLALSALLLSQQISKDTERNATAIPLRYQNKTFIVNGPVKLADKEGDTYRIVFDIPNPWEQALRVPGEAKFKTDIVCLMAKGQSVFALQQKPGKSVKLSGQYADFNPRTHVLWIKDCRPVK